MNYRLSIGAGALLLSFAFNGCAHKPAQHPESVDEQPPVERYSQLAQQGDGTTADAEKHHTDLKLDSSKTQDILAQKTASYAEEVERLLAARAAEKAVGTKNPISTGPQLPPGARQVSPAPTTKPAAAKSEVTWVDDPKQLPPVATPQVAQ